MEKSLVEMAAEIVGSQINTNKMSIEEVNRGADQHRVQCGQAKLVGTVHGVWSSTWFWRVATEPGT